jgi:hypothetical protein
MYEAFHAITGAPLTNDADPSVTPPSSAARVFRPEAKQDHAIVQLVDGTSCTATAWSYRDSAWIEAHAGQGNEANLVAGVPGKIAVDPGALTFIRLTSIVGSPTVAVAFPAREAQSFLSRLAASSRGGSLIVAGLSTLHTDIATTLKNAVDAVATAVATLTAALDSNTKAALLAEHDTNTFTATRGITVSGSGTLVAQFAEDSGTVSIDVVPGYYPYSIILLHTDTAGITVHGHY